MATSISQAQAKALAEGFLDNIGDRDRGLRAEESVSAFYQLAGDLVTRAQENLNKVDRVSTGALSESIKIVNPQVIGKSVVIEIEALYYYKFVDAGVKGVRSGGPSKYSFKNLGVSKKMMEAIRKWVIKEGIKIQRTKKYSAISKREAKRKKITDTSTQTALIIARSIKRKGLKKTNFFTDAIEDTKKDAKDTLNKALKLDIIKSIPKKM